MPENRHGPEHSPRSREAIREMIEDVACCPKGQYCTLKEILCAAPRQTREILQIKCVEKFKYERGPQVRREVDWQEAFELWVSEGHAARFAHCYRDGIHFAELYREIMRTGRDHPHG